MITLFKICVFVIFTISLCFCYSARKSPLHNKIICIDPGHGGTAAIDSFRVGPTGEREEWINLRVALLLKKKLETIGAIVCMTRSEDIQAGLNDRALLARNNHADIFISIHHNATADSIVNFPIIYFHGNASENQASVQLGKILAQQLSDSFYRGESPISLVSEHVIFPESGTAVLRHSYGIPGIIGEASFFTNPTEENRLKNKNYNLKEAEAYAKGLEHYFTKKTLPILQKDLKTRIKPFIVFQEAGRMNEIAKRWKDDFEAAKLLFKMNNIDSINKAYDLFTRSVKSFPDSWVAGQSHAYRSQILNQLGKLEEAEMENKRVKEFYILPSPKL